MSAHPEQDEAGDDARLKTYVRVFKQLPRETAAELLVAMLEDEQLRPEFTIKQATLLTVAGNRLWGSQND